MPGVSRLELENLKLFLCNNIACHMTESTVHPEKTCGFFPAGCGEMHCVRQKETLMSPEIAVGGGMSFIPMEFSQS